MKSAKQFFGHFLLRIIRLIPPKSAAAGFMIGLAALLTTSTTSCEPQVMCYDPAPPDTIPQDTVDTVRQTIQTDTFEKPDEKR